MYSLKRIFLFVIGATLLCISIFFDFDILVNIFNSVSADGNCAYCAEIALMKYFFLIIGLFILFCSLFCSKYQELSKRFSKFIDKERIGKKTFIFIVIFLCLLVLIPLWSFKYIPLQDNPNHLYSIHVMNNIENSNYLYSDNFYVDYSEPKPYFLVYLVLQLFSLIVPLLLAEKLFLSLYVIIFVLSGIYFLRSFKQQDFKAILLFPIIFSWSFFMGFYNFIFSLPLALFFIGYFFRNRNSLDLKKIIFMNLILLLIFFTHIISLMVCLLIVFLILLFEHQSLKKLFMNLIYVSPALIISLFSAISFSSSEGINFQFEGIIQSLKNLFFHYFIPLSFLDVFIAIIFVIFVYMISFNEFKTLLNDISKKKSLKFILHNDNYAIISFILLIFYFVFPISFGGDTWYLNLRVLPFLFVFLLISRKKFSNKLINVTYFFGILLILLLVFNMFYFFNVANKNLKIIDSGLDKIEPNSKIIYFYYGDKSSINYLEHIWGYYGIERGAICSLSFAGTDFSPLRFKQNDLPRPFVEEYYGVVKPNETFFSNYDYVLIWNDNNKSNLIPFEYELIYHNSSFMIFKVVK